MGSGGARKGAGRPKGQGKYRESTKPIRIPESMISDVMKYLSIKGYKLPLYASTVQAGFPSPADDYIEEQMTLQKKSFAGAWENHFGCDCLTITRTAANRVPPTAK